MRLASPTSAGWGADQAPAWQPPEATAQSWYGTALASEDTSVGCRAPTVQVPWRPGVALVEAP